MKEKPGIKPVQRGFWYKKSTRTAAVWMIEILIALILAAGISFGFGASVTIQESSMDPSLQAGDTVLIDRVIYSVSGIRRGDLIAYKKSGQTDASVHVKRVIGLPGETITIKDGLILINGNTYIEDKTLPSINNAGIAADGVTLGESEYFVLGDNRNSSEDSRFTDIGNIARTSVIGKVWFVSSPAADFGFAK